MGRIAIFGIALVVAAFALVAAGCGGSDDEETSSAATWAQDFCGAVTTWTDDLQQIQDDVTASPSVDALEDAAQEASDATDAFLDEIRGLGSPETESGDEIETSVEALTEAVDNEKAEIELAIDDADGIAGAAGAISAIGSSVAAMAAALQSTVQTIEDADAGGELRTAFEETPACDDLTSES